MRSCSCMYAFNKKKKSDWLCSLFNNSAIDVSRFYVPFFACQCRTWIDRCSFFLALNVFLVDMKCRFAYSALNRTEASKRIKNVQNKYPGIEMFLIISLTYMVIARGCYGIVFFWRMTPMIYDDKAKFNYLFTGSATQKINNKMNVKHTVGTKCLCVCVYERKIVCK